MLADLTLVVEGEWRGSANPGLIARESHRKTVTSAHCLGRLLYLVWSD